MKRLLKKLMLVLIILPCAVIFAACGGDDSDKTETTNPPSTPPATGVSVSSISVELTEENDFVVDEETGAIVFEYGSVVEFEKEHFVVTALKSDETSAVVTDYTLDASTITSTTGVGTYQISFTYSEKSTTFDVKINPKKIEKPSFNSENFEHTYTTDMNGDAEEKQIEIQEFDANTMQYSNDSVLKATNAGDYKIKISPKANYVWAEYETSETEEIVIDWVIKRGVANMASPETLSFEWTGEEISLNFVDFSDDFKFEDWFEIESGSAKGTDKHIYYVVVSLNEEKFDNYSIYETTYIIPMDEDDDIGFVYLDENGEETEQENAVMIKYFWQIVEDNI